MNRKWLMRWELLPFWSISQRMGNSMKRRRYLESYFEARLERARGQQQRSKSLEQVRAEAQEAEAQNTYDKFFKKMGKRG